MKATVNVMMFDVVVVMECDDSVMVVNGIYDDACGVVLMMIYKRD